MQYKATLENSRGAPQGAEVGLKLRGIGAPLAAAPEELRLVKVVPSVGSPPQRVRVADGHVVTALDGLRRSYLHFSLHSEALAAVGRATVL